MFELDDIRKTRAVQELQEEAKTEGRQEGRVEGKIETIPALVERGFSAEEIAQILQLDVETVRQVMSGDNGN